LKRTEFAPEKLVPSMTTLVPTVPGPGSKEVIVGPEDWVTVKTLALVALRSAW
jgi:hypothetical protein